jgi:Mg-chelatase subunit ChlD
MATKKKSSPVSTSIIAVIDKSGSMKPLQQSTIGGFNSFLMEQQQEPGRAALTTVLFANEATTLYHNQDIQSVEPLNEDTYSPQGGTALYDALGNALMLSDGGGYDKVIVLVITDGYENASTVFDLPKVQSLIRSKKSKGWEFIFMGANVEKQVAYNLGFDAQSTFSYMPTVNSNTAVYASASGALSKTRSGAAQTVSQNINQEELTIK